MFSLNLLFLCSFLLEADLLSREGRRAREARTWRNEDSTQTSLFLRGDSLPDKEEAPTFLTRDY